MEEWMVGRVRSVILAKVRELDICSLTFAGNNAAIELCRIIVSIAWRDLFSRLLSRDLKHLVEAVAVNKSRP